MTVRRLFAAAQVGGVVAAAAGAASCGALHPCFANCNTPLAAQYTPDPAAASTVVTVMPTAPWTEVAVTVRKGERLLFTARGDVFWERSRSTTGPDGYKGVAGWSVGRGGLVGKVGIDGKSFDIGARVGLFPDKHARPPHHPYPPPPLEMPSDGTLYVGFKEFTAGANTGTFTVTISQTVKAAP